MFVHAIITILQCVANPKRLIIFDANIEDDRVCLAVEVVEMGEPVACLGA